jgi:short subunit dehydrogenase-like uncharacterized protein
MAGRIVLFGATGYTGTLTAEELARVGVPAVLAGRSRSRLGALAHRLGAGFTVATADVSDPGTVAALVGPGDVLVSTVGPFTKFGEPALRAAIDGGAHYVDSTGEPGFIRRVFEEFGPQAQAAGVVLLTAFGYDYVPGNVAGALALEAGGPAATQVDVGYFSARMRPSGGTLASLLGASRAPHFAWRDGRLVTERAGARVARFNLGGPHAEALSIGGSEHLGLPASYPQLRSVGTYLGWFGPLTRVVQVAGAGQALLDRVPGVPGLASRFAERFAPGSTGGPDAAARSRARATVVGVARDDDGRELATVRLHGVDVYTLTARLLVWAARHLRDGAAPVAGARGPVEAFGLEVMARALTGAGLPTVATRRART